MCVCVSVIVLSTEIIIIIIHTNLFRAKTTRTGSARNYIQRLFGMKFTRDIAGTPF